MLSFDHVSELCLKSVLSAVEDRGDVEVIVVDNNPSNEALVLKDCFESVIVIKELKRGSYAARNSGIREARGDNIIFCDSDCLVKKQWFTAFERALKKSEVVCGNCVTYKPKKIFEFFQAKLVRRWNVSLLASAGSYMAGVAAVKRSVFDRVGNFDERFLYSGDIDFGLRLKRHGLDVCIERNAVAYHHPKKTLKIIMNTYYNYGYGNGCIMKKWKKSAPDFIRKGQYRIISALWHFSVWLYWLVNRRKDLLGRKRLWHFFIGVIDFFSFLGFINALLKTGLLHILGINK
jgi:GT2 family glycosyltransferase